MVETARKTGKKLMIRMNMRDDQKVQFLKQIIAKGELGDIYHVNSVMRRPMGDFPGSVNERAGIRYSRNWFNEWKKGGGILRDLGSHMIDLGLFLTGFPEVKDATGNVGNRFSDQSIRGTESDVYDADDHTMALVRFQNGMSMYVEVSFGSFSEKGLACIEVFGKKGGVYCDFSEVKVFFKKENGYLSAKMISCLGETPDGLKEFVDAVLDDTPEPIPGEIGLKTQQIIDLIYASAGWDVKQTPERK